MAWPTAEAVTADWTKAVVAIWVVRVPAAAVGALGVPVSVGDAAGAFAFHAAFSVSVANRCVASWVIIVAACEDGCV